MWLGKEVFGRDEEKRRGSLWISSLGARRDGK